MWRRAARRHQQHKKGMQVDDKDIRYREMTAEFVRHVLNKNFNGCHSAAAWISLTESSSSSSPFRVCTHRRSPARAAVVRLRVRRQATFTARQRPHSHLAQNRRRSRLCHVRARTVRRLQFGQSNRCSRRTVSARLGCIDALETATARGLR
jgi:hypothetical protein